MIKKMNKNGLFSIILVILLYSSGRIIKHSPSMPSITNIFKALIEIFYTSDFYINLLYTIKIVVVGISISFAVGVVFAILCSMCEWLNDLIMPIVNATKNIPSIALFPLFIVLMGIGDAPRIFVIIWNSIYPIISSTFVGLNSSDQEIIDAAQNCGATKWQVYRYIRIPISVLDMLNGLKISVGNGFIAIVVAEMLGATKGLGYMVLWSSNSFQYPQMYVYILVIALIGLIINVVIDKIIKVTERKIYYESNKKKSNKKKSSSFITYDDSVGNVHGSMWKRFSKRNIKDEVCRSESL